MTNFVPWNWRNCHYYLKTKATHNIMNYTSNICILFLGWVYNKERGFIQKRKGIGTGHPGFIEAANFWQRRQRKFGKDWKRPSVTVYIRIPSQLLDWKFNLKTDWYGLTLQMAAMATDGWWQAIAECHGETVSCSEEVFQLDCKTWRRRNHVALSKVWRNFLI